VAAVIIADAGVDNAGLAKQGGFIKNVLYGIGIGRTVVIKIYSDHHDVGLRGTAFVGMIGEPVPCGDSRHMCAMSVEGHVTVCTLIGVDVGIRPFDAVAERGWYHRAAAGFLVPEKADAGIALGVLKVTVGNVDAGVDEADDDARPVISLAQGRQA
jgi:hypothetical protein